MLPCAQDQIIFDFIDEVLKAAIGVSLTDLVSQFAQDLLKQLGLPTISFIDDIFPDILAGFEAKLVFPFEELAEKTAEVLQCFTGNLLSPYSAKATGVSELEMISAQGTTSVTLDCTNAKIQPAVPFMLTGLRRTDKCLRVGRNVVAQRSTARRGAARRGAAWRGVC